VIRRRLAFFATLLFASSPWSVAASVPGPSSPSIDPCASAVPDLPNDLQATFAYDLQSPAILHFVDALATVPRRDQKRVFDSAVDAASSPAQREAETAVATLCPNLDGIYGASRTLYLIANEWKLGEVADSQRFNDFSKVVETAVASLSAGDRLAPPQRRSAMLPFADLLTLSTPSPSPSRSKVCSRADAPAQPVRVIQPNYPPLALSASTTGSVLIKLSLSNTGEIHSVRLFADTLRGGLGAQDIIRATILAAAAGTYAPEIRDCKPIAGTYIFKADYSRR